jgi:hypothetical protein
MELRAEESMIPASVDETTVNGAASESAANPEGLPPESAPRAGTRTDYNTAKYGSLLPPLSAEEYERLKASLELVGQRDPIYVDEDRMVLDGCHRLAICSELNIEPKVKVLSGMNEAKKVEFAYSKNLDRRQLPKKKEKRIRGERLANLLKLRESDPKTYTNERIGSLLGRDESWVRKLAADGNRKNPDASKRDGRHNHSPALVEKAVKRVLNGEVVKAVAAELGIPERVIRIARNKALRAAESASSAPPSPAETRSPEPVAAEVTVDESVAADDDSVPPLVRQVLEQQGMTDFDQQRKWYDNMRRNLGATGPEILDRVQVTRAEDTPLMNLLMSWMTLAHAVRYVEERINTLLHSPAGKAVRS